MADLITVEDYKLYLSRVYSQDNKNENDLYYSNILLPGFTKAIKTFYNNDFQSISRTQTYSVQERTKKLFPRYWPVSSITSVTISGTVQGTDTYKLLQDENSFVLQSDTNIAGQIVESYFWPFGFNHIVIVFLGGYALDRGDTHSLCKLCAKIDDSDTKQFSSAEAAEERFFSELQADNQLNDYFRRQFDRPFI